MLLATRFARCTKQINDNQHRLTMTKVSDSLHSLFTAARTCALVLVILGGSVLSAWHNPEFFNSAYDLFVLMAYGTAMGFLLSGAALLSLTWRLNSVARTGAMACLVIPMLSLFELWCRPEWDINRALMVFVTEVPDAPVRMAPTTAISFILVSLAITCLSSGKAENQGRYVLVAFLSLLVFAIGSIALVGHAVGLIPSFKWFGVKMAPQTAVGFLIMSAGVISYSYKPALMAFSRLNFFKSYGDSLWLYDGIVFGLRIYCVKPD